MTPGEIFSWRWRPGSALGTTFYAGISPYSEPETRFAHRIILRLRPDITIVVRMDGSEVELDWDVRQKSRI